MNQGPHWLMRFGGSTRMEVLLRMLDLTFFFSDEKENASMNMRFTIDSGLRYRGVQPVSIDGQHGGTCRATDPTTRCVGMKVPLVLSHDIGDMLLFSLAKRLERGEWGKP